MVISIIEVMLSLSISTLIEWPHPVAASIMKLLSCPIFHFRIIGQTGAVIENMWDVPIGVATATAGMRALNPIRTMITAIGAVIIISIAIWTICAIPATSSAIEFRNTLPVGAVMVACIAV